MTTDLTGKSKFLSYVLRHAPDSIGLKLDAQGWADVEELLSKCRAVGQPFDRARLLEVVGTNTKRRFTLSGDGTRIRAAQGHSLEVELGLEPVEPPTTLFHGTAVRFLDAIRKTGLKSGRRRHVHLSGDAVTALAVGERHGKPAVLHVAAGAMYQERFAFFRADNGVWLTDHVPPQFLAE